MRLLMLCLVLGSTMRAGERPGDWHGNYAPCHRHRELQKQERMSLGVRISTTNPVLAAQFLRAMDFWAGILDMDWYEEDTPDCSIQLVDGGPDLFKETLQAARAQFPDQPAFQGWIAFNPKMDLTDSELYLTSVHELGHMLGLPHNPSAWSVMFYLSLDASVSLDTADLASLAARHKLRVAKLDKPLAVTGTPSRTSPTNEIPRITVKEMESRTIPTCQH
jgi:Matrixin